MLNLFKKNLTQDDFATIAQKALRKAGDERSMRYNSDDFCIEFESQGDWLQRWLLDNAYHHYRQANKPQRKDTLDRFIASILDTKQAAIPTNYEEVKNALLPTVREPVVWESSRIMSQTEGGQFEPLVSDAVTVQLAKVLAYDTQHSIAFVPQSSLRHWEVSQDQVFAQAIDNLRRLSTGEGFVLVQPGVYMSSWMDDYDCARLLLPELFYRLELLGNPIVSMPSRSVLLVTGSKDVMGLSKLEELTRSVLSDDQQPLTGFVLEYKDNHWTPFPTNPERHVGLYNLNVEWFAFQYNEQKAMLEKHFEKIQHDVFVASVLMFEDKATGVRRSVSVWADGVETLLPETDVVNIQSEDGEKHMLVKWQDMYRIVGHYLTATDHTPTRYFVKEYPNTDEFAALSDVRI